MEEKTDINFEIHKTLDAEVITGTDSGVWQLKIPPGPRGEYRLAQLDDSTAYSRGRLKWEAPVTLNLRARASATDIPGTWGFGFWNDPFSLSLGLGGGTRRFPALPNASWFFFASPENYLSFRNDMPAKGFIAQTFRSPKLPTALLGLGVPLFPLLLWSWLARKFRVYLRRIVAEDSFAIDIDVTQWRDYTLEWQMDQLTFQAGDQTFKTKIVPKSRLGFVLWIDNQYAAFPPNGKLSFGTLPNLQSAWLEIEKLTIKT